MVGTNKALPSNDGTYLRKIRKPLIEKKRRERMNQSITQLRALIDDTVKQNVAPMTRVDKADILELTVCHLTKLRHQQPVTTATDKRMSYTAGFQDCAHQVTSFLVANGLIDSIKMAELNQHLQLSATRRSTQLIQTTSHTSTPVRVPTRVPTLIQPLGHPQINFPTESPIHHYDVYSGFISPANCVPRHHSDRDGIPSTSCSGESSSSFLSPEIVSSTPHSRTSSLEDSSSYSLILSKGDSGISDGTVSIGTGSENKIGHVIQETTWRPW